MASQVVLACGKEDRRSFVGGAVIERGLPEIVGVRLSDFTLRPSSTQTPAAAASASSAVSSALRVSEAAGNGNGASAARLAAARRT